MRFFVCPMWLSFILIPVAWTVCYFIGQFTQAHGLGWF